MKYDKGYVIDKWSNWLKDENLYRLRSEYARRNYFEPLKLSGYEKIFEFGCGIGQNIAWHNNSYAYDVNKDVYPMLKKKGIKMFNNTYEIPNEEFDVIITCMVLEHTPNPITVIKMLRDKLKPNGRLVTVLPLPHPKIGIRGGLNSTKDGHLFAWTFYEINCLLNYCGFENLVNKKLYLKGIEKFKSFPDSIYFPLLKSFGRLYNDYDIMIVSKKMEVK